MYMIRGELPYGYSAMASADMKYIKEHGKAWLASGIFHKMHLHLNLVGGTYDDWMSINMLRGVVWQRMGGRITLSQSLAAPPGSEEETRTFYACSRFLLAAELTNSASMLTGFRPALLLTDIDCIFQSNFPIPDRLGLFLRDSIPGTVGWEAEGTRVAAGIVYVPSGDYHFLRDVAAFIENEHPRWFLDQVALSRVAQNRGLVPPHVHMFDNKDMDWEFVPGTKIWTGKGDRKYHNAVYLARKRYYEDMV